MGKDIKGDHKHLTLSDRYTIPKGRSMHNLTDEKVREMICHIDSVARDGLNGKCPFDLARLD